MNSFAERLTKIFLLLAMFIPSAMQAQVIGDTVISNNPKNLKLKVLYFHITNRCETCTNVEKYLRSAINDHFSAELKSGVIDLYILNCELPENKDLVAKYEAYGATLAFSHYVAGMESPPEDLTGWAFRRAGKPEVFIAEFKQMILDKIK